VTAPALGLLADNRTSARRRVAVRLVGGISALKWWCDRETQSAVA